MKVHVMLKDSDRAHTYEGDYDVALVGTSIVVSENVPNVASMVGEDTIPVIRSIYNASRWEQVSCT